MIFAITNEFKNMNRQHDEDREEFRTFSKEYEIDREERKGSGDISFREDFRSLVQQVTKLERDLNDKKSRKQSNMIPHKSSPNSINATRLFSVKQ